MTIRAEPVVFNSAGSQLTGIFEFPESPAGFGVLLVTGGPQYRIGSHRQYVSIARALASSGITSFRFDYRGVGDSVGDAVTFDTCSTDIAAAIDVFVARTGIRNVTLWGLCDAASACMIYGGADPRVESLILLNPWVRSASGQARTFVKHYYLSRVISAGFWRKVFSGQFRIAASLRELNGNVTRAFFSRKENVDAAGHTDTGDFRARMLTGITAFGGRALFVLCGDDLTAAEFNDYAKQSRAWSKVMRRKTVTQKKFPSMDHTFSNSVWRDQVIDVTEAWIKGQPWP